MVEYALSSLLNPENLHEEGTRNKQELNKGEEFMTQSKKNFSTETQIINQPEDW